MSTDVGMFFARLLHVEKLQKCFIFSDWSPENWSKAQRTGNRWLAETERIYQIHILKEGLSHIGSKSPLGEVVAMKFSEYCVKTIKYGLITQ
jgi:hypothetical protein